MNINKLPCTTGCLNFSLNIQILNDRFPADYLINFIPWTRAIHTKNRYIATIYLFPIIFQSIQTIDKPAPSFHTLLPDMPISPY